MVEASHDKSPPCLVWCPWVFCKWRYNVICHVVSQYHLIEESCNFVGAKSLQNVTTLTSLVVTRIMVVEICF